ncbi:MAG TPA: cytidine deaminase [bacterium]|jgi:cytidine deaminase|nr:cytidine deaminase [bacterium]
MTNQELIAQALSVVKPRKIGKHTSSDVGCALLAADGKVYLGVCVDVPCGIGFCAEHSAIAAMVTAGEHRIAKIVAVDRHGEVLAPCGRCREFMRQLDDANEEAVVVITPDLTKTLKELLPHPW